MKTSGIRPGLLYFSDTGMLRRVVRISDWPNFIDGYIVTYRNMLNDQLGPERYCTLRVFAHWALALKEDR